MDSPNPILIMVINMTIVFAVLYVLGLFIRFIHMIDPTKKLGKKQQQQKPHPVMSKQTVRDSIHKDDMADKTLAAIIITSLTAYGCRDFEIKSIKKL